MRASYIALSAHYACYTDDDDSDRVTKVGPDANAEAFRTRIQTYTRGHAQVLIHTSNCV